MGIGWASFIAHCQAILVQLPWLRQAAGEICQLGLAFIVTFLVIQPLILASYATPTGSMEPTIMANSRYLALPAIFGGFLRFTAIKLPGLRPIRRGDIVIFKLPQNPKLNYVKRVVGLPGERVALRGKVAYIDGNPLPEPYAQYDPAVPDDSRSDYGPVVVPENHLLVLGDNRDHSWDSRYWGFVPVRNVFGTPLVVFWSYDRERRRIRLKELGKPIR